MQTARFHLVAVHGLVLKLAWAILMDYKSFQLGVPPVNSG